MTTALLMMSALTAGAALLVIAEFVAIYLIDRSEKEKA